MINNFLRFIFFSTLIGCMGKQPPIQTGLEGKSIPSFKLKLMDSLTKIDTKNIPSGHPIVLLYVSPYCPYCRAQTEEILSEIKSLSKIQFYIFSSFPYSDIRQYYDKFHLEKYQNITVGQDYESYFKNRFNVKAVPFLAIYDPNKRLKQAFIGKISTDLIMDITSE